MQSLSVNSLWQGRRCLVTGATGFIGSVLCRRLLTLGAEVHAAHRGVLLAQHGIPIKCDVSKMSEVRRAFVEVRPDCVFHLAGMVSGARDLHLVETSFSANLVGTINILLAATEARCSNVVTLGSLQEPDQDWPPVPCGPYAASKFAASAYARMFAEVYALPVSIARPLMVYGPGQLDFNKLVPYVSRQLISGAAAELSSGRHAFDWVYVDDVVDALLVIGSSTNLAGRTIDIGLGKLTTVAEIALGIGQRLERTGMIKFGVVPDRRLEPIRTADVAGTEALIGWRPQTSVEEGLDRTVAWYRAQLGG